MNLLKVVGDELGVAGDRGQADKADDLGDLDQRAAVDRLVRIQGRRVERRQVASHRREAFEPNRANLALEQTPVHPLFVGTRLRSSSCGCGHDRVQHCG